MKHWIAWTLLLLPTQLNAECAVIWSSQLVPSFMVKTDTPVLYVEVQGCPPFTTGYHLDGNTFHVEVGDACVACGGQTTVLEIPLERVPSGSYEVVVEDRRPIEFEVHAKHLLRPELVFGPRLPTDNERVRVQIATDSHCFYSLNEPRIEQQGSTIDVLWDASAAGCVIPLDMLDVHSIEVGPLEAGDYTVRLRFREPPVGGDLAPEPYRVLRESLLRVSDAPDVAQLRDDRFAVTVEWQDFENRRGGGKPVPGASDESALFSFFGRDNWEVMVKVLDGCALNDRYWVFTAGATNVEYTVAIEDLATGETWSFDNPLGERSEATADTDAFATCDASLSPP